MSSFLNLSSAESDLGFKEISYSNRVNCLFHLLSTFCRADNLDVCCSPLVMGTSRVCCSAITLVDDGTCLDT